MGVDKQNEKGLVNFFLYKSEDCPVSLFQIIGVWIWIIEKDLMWRAEEYLS